MRQNQGLGNLFGLRSQLRQKNNKLDWHHAHKDSLKTQKDYYLQKAKKKRTTSFILFGTGAGLVIAGVVDAASTGEYTGLIPILAGTIVMLSSVPFFNAAANYKRKANSITFTRQI